MKKIFILCMAFIAFSLTAKEGNLEDSFVLGNPSISSINALSFGPDGILFIGDSQEAKVFALDTKDTNAKTEIEDFSINSIDKKIAEKLGTTAENVSIEDMAVNPVSKNIYLAVTNNSATPILMKLEDGELSIVSLDNVYYSELSLNEPISEEKTDRRGNSQRKWAISDINFYNGKVMVTGLSNKEFSSTFRAIPFPFKDNQMMSSLEIYHAAHGRYETYAPVKAFTATNISGKEMVVASYTCTPLVVFPMDEFKEGKHMKGRTVAELGNWNTPLDMIVMQKEGANYILMANSNRALMKIKVDDIENYDGSLTSPVEERSATAGVDFIALPFVNVQQLDKLTEDKFVMLQRKNNGELTLYTSSNRWL